MGALSLWTRRETNDSKVLQRHEKLASINITLSEYAELIEQVSLERAELLKTISKLQLENAELSVSKALFTDLEVELKDMRTMGEQAQQILETNRVLKGEFDIMRQERDKARQEAAILRREVGSLKGQLTKAKKRAE